VVYVSGLGIYIPSLGINIPRPEILSSCKGKQIPPTRQMFLGLK
jgi:hypothetical protein